MANPTADNPGCIYYKLDEVPWQDVYETLKNLGVTHLIWLPDTESGHMWDEMSAQGAIKLIQVTREGEAVGIAAGLIATGKNPVVLIQSTGLFESGDSMRGLAIE